jgi:hypothetical protein
MIPEYTHLVADFGTFYLASTPRPYDAGTGGWDVDHYRLAASTDDMGAGSFSSAIIKPLADLKGLRA